MKIYSENLVSKPNWGNQGQKNRKNLELVETNRNRKNQVFGIQSKERIISMHKTLCTLNFGLPFPTYNFT